MLNLNDKNWRAFYFGELFQMKNGYFHKRPPADKNGALPFLGSSDSNNGITEYLDVKTINYYNKTGSNLGNVELNKKIYNGPAIVVNNSGSVGHSYYQEGSFTASDHTTTLHLKNYSLNRNIALFLIPLIELQGQLFGFYRQWSLIRMYNSRIMLPVNSINKPDYDFMNNYIHNIIKNKNKKINQFIDRFLPQHELSSISKLEDKKWQDYSFDDLFDMKTGFYGKRPECNNEGNIPFLGATDHNNGITEWLTKDEINKATKNSKSSNVSIDKKIFKGPSIAVTNNGSIGHAYYQTGIYTASSDVTILKLKQNVNQNLNRNIALFLIPCIENQGKSFHYSHKWKLHRMKKSKLLLPVSNNDNIDWQYMNQYIENLLQKKYNKLRKK